jgi:protein TonB
VKKVVIKDIVQPTKQPEPEKKEEKKEEAQDDGVEGGQEGGVKGGVVGGVVGGTVGGVGTGPVEAKPQAVPLNAIENSMIAGDKEIHLPPPILQVMSKQGIKQAILMIKFCINGSGNVTSVDVAKSCGYSEADQNVVSKVHEWKFKPYTVNGQAVPVCSVKMFRYVIE